MSAAPSKKNRLPKVPHDPPQEYFALVGEIALRLSRLEYQLTAMARVAAKLDKDDQRRLFFKLRGEKLCDTLEMLAGFMQDRPRARELRALAKDAAHLAKMRDNYIHSVYGHWPDAPHVPMRFRLTRHDAGQDIVAEKMTVAQLEKLARDLKDIESRAQELHSKGKR